MSNTISQSELNDFFDLFCEVFATFDGARVATLFIAPGIALKQDGSLQGFSDIEDIRKYYQSALDYYKASGCDKCRWSDLQVLGLRDNSIVATVSWELVSMDGTVSRAWRQAYFISRFEGELRIYGSAFADPV